MTFVSIIFKWQFAVRGPQRNCIGFTTVSDKFKICLESQNCIFEQRTKPFLQYAEKSTKPTIGDDCVASSLQKQRIYKLYKIDCFNYFIDLNLLFPLQVYMDRGNMSPLMLSFFLTKHPRFLLPILQVFSLSSLHLFIYLSCLIQAPFVTNNTLKLL